MGMWDAVRREHVVEAAAEYDAIGQIAFLDRYGFGPARAYMLIIDGRSYDSKAVLGAAYSRATGRPISSADFSGGVAVNGAASVLQALGFEVRKTRSTELWPQQPRVPVRQRNAASRPEVAANPDIVLVGCVKMKQSIPAPARELYISPLFSKRRRYAEAAGTPWFILSALHGLVHPEDVLEPYDMYLSGQPASYRREWGQRVVHDLTAEVGSLTGRTIEVHAGSSYVEPLAPLLEDAGAHVKTPLRGLAQGQQLAWYRPDPMTATGAAPSTPPIDVNAAAAAAVATLTQTEPAPANAFPWGRRDLDTPGLYAWWVDRPGATDLGLEPTGDLTLAYTGQAGATRWPSGVRSGATLRSRIGGQHLGGIITSSTLRQTFAALLRDALGLRVIAPKQLASGDEVRLSQWLKAHLWATVWPFHDRDALGKVERRVIESLDAPLNLASAKRSELRVRLSEGRSALSRPDEVPD